jgi:hypothetical protein
MMVGGWQLAVGGFLVDRVLLGFLFDAVGAAGAAGGRFSRQPPTAN